MGDLEYKGIRDIDLQCIANLAIKCYCFVLGLFFFFRFLFYRFDSIQYISNYEGISYNTQKWTFSLIDHSKEGREPFQIYIK